MELLASVAIITILMSAVFTFMYQAQKRFQGNVVVSESNQSARAALEVMSQEIEQAGYNPNLSTTRYITTALTGDWHQVCVTLYSDSAGTTANAAGINPGDWLVVDTGPSNESVQVVGTSTGYMSNSAPNNVTCSSNNQIRAVFETDHPTTPIPVISYKFPYPTGVLAPAQVTPTITPPFDNQLAFYGDINNVPNNIQIGYVLYSLNPVSPAISLPVTGAPCSGTYTLYNLYRSITPVNFTGTAHNNNPASPLVQNVMYDITNQRGPTCQPIFNYPSTFQVGFYPAQITAVGTIMVTISVAVNPQRLESGRIEWYTMATQIRPLNMSAAITTNQLGGYKYLPPKPLDVPLVVGSGYYQ